MNGSAFAGGGINNAADLLVKQLVDPYQGVPDGDRLVYINVDLPVVAAEILERFASSNHMKVRRREPLLLMELKKRLNLPYVGNHLAAHLGPTYWPRLLPAFSTHMDDVVLNLLGAEFPRSFGVVAPDGIGRLEIEAGVKKTLQNRYPRCVLAMMESE